VAESRIALARLALESGQPDEAVDLARRAADEVTAQGLEDDRALALATMAEALRHLGRVEEADDIIERARAVAESVESRGVQVWVAIEAARIDQASGELERARTGLDEARSLAESAGLVGLALEARLARLQLRRAAGAADAPAELLLLAQDADAAGFDRIARHARELG
jgi:ATP/maltotriose-dependent transcriptional regulator MalT